MTYQTSISQCIVQEAEIAEVVLMPGDPLRAKKVAQEYLTDVVCFNTVRNMLGYTGTYKGKRISVMGHGMGIPSIGIYSHELFTQFHVKAIIRIGSIGGLSDTVDTRDLIIAQSASSDSAYGEAFGICRHFAACADYSMLETAVQIAREKNISFKVGNVFTSDFFYHPEADINERLKDSGHLGVDMETAGLYWTAAADHKLALSLLTVSNHLFKDSTLSAEEIRNTFTDMMETALETALQFTA